MSHDLLELINAAARMPISQACMQLQLQLQQPGLCMLSKKEGNFGILPSCHWPLAELLDLSADLRQLQLCEGNFGESGKASEIDRSLPFCSKQGSKAQEGLSDCWKLLSA